MDILERISTSSAATMKACNGSDYSCYTSINSDALMQGPGLEMVGGVSIVAILLVGVIATLLNSPRWD